MEQIIAIVTTRSVSCFFFCLNPLQRSVSYAISEKKVKIHIFKILSHMVAFPRNSEKTEDITTFAYYQEYS